MPKKSTQQTPKDHEIPVPQRTDFDRLVKKAANTPVPEVPETKKPLHPSVHRPKK